MAKTLAENQGALKDIKVLDLTRAAAGPSCSMILADMGAETIKMEPPGYGDMVRTNAPLKDDIGGQFPFLNRNKKSFVLDLQKPRGKELFRGLVKWADIVVENFRPGVMARLGFPYKTLHEINPRVILVSISGFGQNGPYTHRAAFDTVGQAIGGLMFSTGQSVGHPISAGAPVADMTGGLLGTIGALLALHYRERTGKGQWVDASMTEGVLYHLGLSYVQHARNTPEQRAAAAAAAASGASGGMTFQMKDGNWMVIMYHDDSFWPLMARIVGRPDLADHPEYNSRSKRATKREEIHNLVAAWAKTVTSAEITPVLEKEGLPYAPVLTYDQALADPHLKDRKAIEWIEHDTGELLPLVGVFPKLSESPGSIRFQAPHLGEHSEEVFCGILGMSKQELKKLKDEKVIQ